MDRSTGVPRPAQEKHCFSPTPLFLSSTPCTQGVYFHNCDCAAGASGGALLDPSFNVVGINTAHVMPTNPALLRPEDYNPIYPNIAVPAYQFMPTYAHILTQMS